MEHNEKTQGPKFYSSQEEMEMARLREALNRTDNEKFLYLTQLMKIQQFFQRAVISSAKS